MMQSCDHTTDNSCNNICLMANFSHHPPAVTTAGSCNFEFAKSQRDHGMDPTLHDVPKITQIKLRRLGGKLRRFAGQLRRFIFYIFLVCFFETLNKLKTHPII
jgi:hypothetical protein